MNLTQMTWTKDVVKEWLETAALVERALPPVYRKGAAGPKWNIIREWYELLWDDPEDIQGTPLRPTSEQISIWEEVVLRWYRLIDSDTDKKIIWMRTMGYGWVKIGKKVGLSRQTVAGRYDRALANLTDKLPSFYHKISIKKSAFG